MPPSDPVCDPESEALLALLLTPGLGPTLVGRCREAFGSAQDAMGQTAARWGQVRGISPRRSAELKRAADQVVESGAVDRERDAVARAGALIVGLHEPAYPALLKLIPDPPPLLWIHGGLRGDDALALGLVGSRRCSAYGREQADRFAAQACAAGLCVISGGAYGIDVAAHRAALRVKGRTLAVIGSGLGKPYPADHLEVFRAIAREGRGAVISELPLATAPRPENFPRRNRIISGLSLGVLVVEAAKRSGALITARLAVEEHARECMALPGRVDTPGSAGGHQLIREGQATLVTSIADVLDQLGEAGQTLKAAAGEPAGGLESGVAATGGPAGAGLSGSQAKIVAVLNDARALPLDRLGALTSAPIGTLQGDLTVLELRGVVRKTAAGFLLAR